MKFYTVHEPRKLTGDPGRDAERFAFVRDGFHFWAFVLAPLWMLWRRLWLALLLYVLTMIVLQVGLWAAGVSKPVQFVVGVLVSLLIGFEAGTLHRWTLTRRGWRNLGVVVGRDRADAERRFFDSWTRGDVPGPSGSPPSVANAQPMPSAPPSSDIIGLFPEPEPRR
jgi:hypothetical protein